jgi:Fe-S cluster assembly iron-binding protein IscA
MEMHKGMIEVTPSAIRKIKDYLTQNDIDSGIRVTLIERGTSGPALGIVLDEPSDADRLCRCEGVQFMIHESLLADCGCITIDFPDGEGSHCSCGGEGVFKIRSERPVSPVCGCSCGSEAGG